MTKTPEGNELKADWKHEAPSKTYKKSEIAQHNTKKDVWIIVHGGVYDVTEYLRDHPGGADTLLDCAGQDATSAYEDVGHSEDAREILHSFLIGVLEGYSAEDALNAKAKPILPDLQLGKREEAPAPQSKYLSTLLSPRAELFAFAFGTAGLAGILYTVSAWHKLASYLKSMSNGNNSFALGYSTAVLSFSMLGVAAIRFMAKATDLGPGEFTAFPPRIKKVGTAPRPAGVLRATEYLKLKLRSKEELADDIWRFVFDLPTKYSILGLPVGQHVAIKGEIDEHTVVRSYTPISNNRDLGRLELLIKVYPGGKIGNYLKNTNEGDTVDIRGPKGAMKYRRSMSKRLGMIGGGTGITPLYQIIRTVCEDPKDDTQIDLLYGNRSESDIMLKEQLDGFARDFPEKFRVYYVLDQAPEGWTGGKGFVDKNLIQQRLPPADPENKILLCGPPGMIKAMIGSLTGLGFEKPGVVSKMSDQIFCF